MSDNIKNIPSPAIDPAAFAVAEDTSKKEKKVNSRIYVHKLDEPFVWEGKTYEELTFNWGKLTGRDGLDIEHELTSTGRYVVSPELSSDYRTAMAAKACTEPIGSDMIEALPLCEFNTISMAARRFLLKLER